jgi:hypothetical protein
MDVLRQREAHGGWVRGAEDIDEPGLAGQTLWQIQAGTRWGATSTPHAGVPPRPASVRRR